ncbi:MAG: ComF family protein [Saprospiraceae bacterium]|nr:ComF family protein [Saprospiraceae bacterium]
MYLHPILEGLEHCFSLFYPQLCLVCERKKPARGEILCFTCQHKLPKTDFHLDPDNALMERFWGRLPLQAAASLFYFIKGGRTQQLIHQLKYNNKPAVGRQLGQSYGSLLKDSPLFQEIDCIIPVPLHRRKQHLRGYNQSETFAQGLSTSMGKPYYSHTLERRNFTQTQTRKSRIERMNNVQEAFQLKTGKALRGKHVLLVDDVITTGATLEACGMQLLTVKDLTLSLATIGFASG